MLWAVRRGGKQYCCLRRGRAARRKHASRITQALSKAGKLRRRGDPKAIPSLTPSAHCRRQQRAGSGTLASRSRAKRLRWHLPASSHGRGGRVPERCASVAHAPQEAQEKHVAVARNPVTNGPRHTACRIACVRPEAKQGSVRGHVGLCHLRKQLLRAAPCKANWDAAGRSHGAVRAVCWENGWGAGGSPHSSVACDTAPARVISLRCGYH